MTYKQVKEELKRRCEKTRYFNKAFYNTYCDVKKEMLRKIEDGNEYEQDKYVKDGILLFHTYDPIYNSKFYKRNSCAYCVFLEIVNGQELIKG
jgi:hypothetical protein